MVVQIEKKPMTQNTVVCTITRVNGLEGLQNHGGNDGPGTCASAKVTFGHRVD